MNDVQKPDNRILDTIIHGDCLALLKTLPSNSVDAIVTDPPSSIHFMGKDWDSNKGGRTQWIAWLAEIMQEALRCLKPGGHAFVWSLPRTSHYTAMALEDAGFEIRDAVSHIQSQGFPKSYNLGNGQGTALKPSHETWWLARKPLAAPTIAENVLVHGTGGLNIDASRISHSEPLKTTTRTAPRYNGIMNNGIVGGQQSTVASADPQGRFPSNTLFSHSPLCLELGTKRVRSHNPGNEPGSAKKEHPVYGKFANHGNGTGYADPDGMEEVQAYDCDPSCPVRLLDEQSGIRKSGGGIKSKAGSILNSPAHGRMEFKYDSPYCEPSTGGASRYFQTFAPNTEDIVPFLYQSKPSRKERNAGCEALPEVERHTQGRDEVHWIDRRDGKGKVPVNGRIQPVANHHPTIKSTALMRYLITMITPPHGIVLDCFAGSGSTLVACTELGMNFIGIEQDAEYVAIAEARIAHARQHGPITPLPLWEVVGHEREKIQSKEGA